MASTFILRTVSLVILLSLLSSGASSRKINIISKTSPQPTTPTIAKRKTFAAENDNHFLRVRSSGSSRILPQGINIDVSNILDEVEKHIETLYLKIHGVVSKDRPQSRLNDHQDRISSIVDDLMVIFPQVRSRVPRSLEIDVNKDIDPLNRMKTKPTENQNQKEKLSTTSIRSSSVEEKMPPNLRKIRGDMISDLETANSTEIVEKLQKILQKKDIDFFCHLRCKDKLSSSSGSESPANSNITMEEAVTNLINFGAQTASSVRDLLSFGKSAAGFYFRNSVHLLGETLSSLAVQIGSEMEYKKTKVLDLSQPESEIPGWMDTRKKLSASTESSSD